MCSQSKKNNNNFIRQFQSLVEQHHCSHGVVNSDDVFEENIAQLIKQFQPKELINPESINIAVKQSGAWVGKTFTWADAMSKLTEQLAIADLLQTTDCKVGGGRSKAAHRINLAKKAACPSFPQTVKNLSRLSEISKKLKGNKCIYFIYRMTLKLKVVWAALEIFLKKVYRALRKLFLIDAFDRFLYHLSTKKQHVRTLAALCTIVEFLFQILLVLFAIMSAIFRPDLILRKLLPREVDNALPSEI